MCGRSNAWWGRVVGPDSSCRKVEKQCASAHMFLTYPASPASNAPSPVNQRDPRSKDCGGDEVGDAPSPVGKRYRIGGKYSRYRSLFSCPPLKRLRGQASGMTSRTNCRAFYGMTRWAIAACCRPWHLDSRGPAGMTALRAAFTPAPSPASSATLFGTPQTPTARTNTRCRLG